MTSELAGPAPATMTYGVISWQGKILVYRPVPKTRGWEAHFQGERELVLMTQDLRRAIEADVQHQRAKAEGRT